MPSNIGKYRIGAALGRGAAGVVFLAEDSESGREVALKLLAPHALRAEATARFRRETEVVARLHHAHLVPIYDMGEVEGQLYYTMEFMRGESLGAKLLRGPLPIAEALARVLEVASALVLVHAEGLVHRDIKPDNILTDDSGSARLTDFGLVQKLDATRLTQTGTGHGTPGFWAPEQAVGKRDRVGARTDVYGLGATLYALLSGKPPLRADTLPELLVRTLERRPTALIEVRPEVGQGLSDVVDRCLEKEPSDRYGSMAELVDELLRVQGGERPLAQQKSVSSLPVLLPVLLLVVALLGLVAALSRPDPSPLPSAPPSAEEPSEPSPAPATSPSQPLVGWRFVAGSEARWDVLFEERGDRGWKGRMHYVFDLRVRSVTPEEVTLELKPLVFDPGHAGFPPPGEMLKEIEVPFLASTPVVRLDPRSGEILGVEGCPELPPTPPDLLSASIPGVQRLRLQVTRHAIRWILEQSLRLFNGKQSEPPGWRVMRNVNFGLRQGGSRLRLRLKGSLNDASGEGEGLGPPTGPPADRDPKVDNVHATARVRQDDEGLVEATLEVDYEVEAVAGPTLGHVRFSIRRLSPEPGE